ncbi:MAG: hypothetical protein AAFU38_13485 [Bacteroidota bacterium]
MRALVLAVLAGGIAWHAASLTLPVRQAPAAWPHPERTVSDPVLEVRPDFAQVFADDPPRSAWNV